MTCEGYRNRSHSSIDINDACADFALTPRADPYLAESIHSDDPTLIIDPQETWYQSVDIFSRIRGLLLYGILFELSELQSIVRIIFNCFNSRRIRGSIQVHLRSVGEGDIAYR